MKEKKGTVVRAKMEKTRIIAIEYRTQHKVYKKVQTKKRWMVVHDEKVCSKVGDKVQIRRIRPISKTKFWEIIKIL